jgi:type IV secretion system protein VirB9
MMSHASPFRALVLGLCLSVALPAAAEEISPVLPSDSRIKTLMYDELDVYTIKTKYGYQTNLVFAPGEEIQTISVGDRSLWQLIPSGNRLFIRPMEENVITNMTLITNRRSYQFDIKSVAANENDNIYVAKFIYPDRFEKSAPLMPVPAPMPAAPAPMPMPEPKATVVGSVPPAAPGATPAPVTGPGGPIAGPGITEPVNPNYNYTYSGPDELAPLQVYDDGKSTYIKYRDPYQPLPNAYMVEADGNEKLTTVYQRDKVMLIDAVASKWILRHSTGAITIYNEMLSPR